MSSNLRLVTVTDPAGRAEESGTQSTDKTVERRSKFIMINRVRIESEGALHDARS